MREIEFRGILVSNKEWVYGDLLQPFKINDNPVYYILDYSKFDYDCFEHIGEVADRFEVIPETVGQFTNWCDINMKKVYEGDYLKVYDTLHNVSFSGYVSYAKGSFVIVGDNDMIHYRWYDYSIEKIGDIHTNPGLLEVIPDE